MRNVILSVVLSAVVAAGISYGAARWATRQEAVNMHDTGWLKRELQLTESQAVEVSKLAEDYRVALMEQCTKHCEARLVLSEELGKPEVSRPAADAAVGAMCAAANEVERITLQHILRVRELLTPAQRAQYAALINRPLCTMYPPVQP